MRRAAVILVGLDEVVASTSARMERAARLHDRGTPQYWAAALDGNQYMLDLPIPEARIYLDSCRNPIVYLSGRRRGTEHLTTWWLKTHRFPDGAVIHREKGTPALKFKVEEIRLLQKKCSIEIAFGHGEPTEEAYRTCGLEFVIINQATDWPEPLKKSAHRWDDL